MNITNIELKAGVPFSITIEHCGNKYEMVSQLVLNALREEIQSLYIRLMENEKKT